MSPGQERGLEQGQTFILDPTSRLNIEQTFGRNAPTVLEIGFGMGHSLLEMATANPGINFIGAEVHRPGVGRLLNEALKAELNNIRVYNADVVEVLAKAIPEQSLDKIMIFFPDPWHKKKHHKRRLVQAPFIKQLLSKLKPKGIIHCATDWQDYAEQMMSVLSEFTELHNVEGPNQYANAADWRPGTKFEARGVRLGHDIYDCVFRYAANS